MQTHTLDNRGLTPPNPMIRTLQLLEEVPEGDIIEIINDRQPMFLYAELDERGYSHEAEQLEDGSFKIRIFKSSNE